MDIALARRTIARMDEAVRDLAVEPTAHGARTREALDQAWLDLQRTVDLGPEPDLRPCPFCGREGNRGATICGYCWRQLPA